MRKLMAVLLAAAAILATLPVALAESDGEVTIEPFGYLRVRPEFVRNLTDVSVEDDEFGLVFFRARVGMNVLMPRKVTLTLDLQSLGTYGENDGPFRGFHGGRNPSDANVNLFQGYLEMADIRDSSLSLRFGRQAMVLGDEWLVGDSDFYGGVSFDAIRLDYGYGDGHRLTAFWSKLAEIDELGFYDGFALDMGVTGLQPDGAQAYDSGADDVDFVGLWNTWNLNETQILDGYLLRLDNRTQLEKAGEGEEESEFFASTEDRWTLGLRFNRPRGEKWDLNVNAAYQFGDIYHPECGTERDVRAHALEVEGGWTFLRDNNLKSRVRAFVATYSGDDDPEDKGDRRFSILFQDRHGRYGLADFFTGVFLPNLVSDIAGMDLFGLGFETQLGERWSVGGNAIGANVAKNPLTVNPSVAYEGDIFIHLDYTKYLSFDVGFAHVFARSFFLDYERFGSDQNASRIYVHAVAKF